MKEKGNYFLRDSAGVSKSQIMSQLSLFNSLTAALRSFLGAVIVQFEELARSMTLIRSDPLLSFLISSLEVKFYVGIS